MASTTRKVTAAVQAQLAEAVQGTTTTLAQAKVAYRDGATVADIGKRAATGKAATASHGKRGNSPELTPANAAQAAKVGKQQAEAKAEAAKVAPRTPRSTAAASMLAAAEQGGWQVREIAPTSPEAQAVAMLNPRRGVRNWCAEATRGNSTMFLSTLTGHLHGSVHADRCTLTQAGTSRLVEYVYEIVGTLASKPTRDGLATVPTKDEARKRALADA